MPIYRIKDGKESLQQNDEIFDKTIHVLSENHKLIILPEGSHSDFHRLRILKKGICRIALQTVEKNDFQLDLQIIPVGLEYGNYRKFYQPFMISFGKPILIKNYNEQYKSNPNRTYNELRAELSLQMKKLIVHIENQEYYYMYDNLRELYKYEMIKHLNLPSLQQPNKLKADKVLIQILDNIYEKTTNAFEDLNKKVESYTEGLIKFNLRDWIFNKEKYNFGLIILQSFFHLITFPLFIYGVINNFLPYYLPIRAARKMKDPQFFSSIKFVLSSYAFPVFYILQTLLLRIFDLPGWILWTYLLSLPFSFYFALHYYFWYKKMAAKVKYNKYKKTEEFKVFIKTRKEIFDLLNQWVKQELPQIDKSDYWNL